MSGNPGRLRVHRTSGVATVSPASAQTDASGNAQATVQGVAAGSAAISATAAGATDTSTVDDQCHRSAAVGAGCEPVGIAAAVDLGMLAMVHGRAGQSSAPEEGLIGPDASTPKTRSRPASRRAWAACCSRSCCWSSRRHCISYFDPLNVGLAQATEWLLGQLEDPRRPAKRGALSSRRLQLPHHLCLLGTAACRDRRGDAAPGTGRPGRGAWRGWLSAWWGSRR